MVTAAAANLPTLDIQFDRANKIYQPSEQVAGTISLKNFEQQMAFEAVELEAEAYMDTVSLIRGNLGRPALPKDKRIMIMAQKKTVASNGILFPNGDPLNFSFKLESTTSNQLIDSYVGVDFSIIYKVTVTLIKRKGEVKPLEATAKFDCKVPGSGVCAEYGRRNKP